jgi:hypothetical protein
LTNGTRQPARISHAERGSAVSRCANANARRAISQFIRTTTLAITANSATTLTAIPSHVAIPATHGFNNVLRLISSSAYRAMCTMAATPRITTVAHRVRRTIAADGPGAPRPAAWPGSYWSSNRSVRPQRGMTP